MPYAFIQDVPIDAATYATIRARLGDDHPAGLLSHVVIEEGTGLRYVDVWSSEADWKAFHDDRLLPVLLGVFAEHGIVPDPAGVQRRDVPVLDVWTGAAHSSS